MDLFTSVLDLVFPRTCVGCQAPGTVACVDCWRRWKSPWRECSPVPAIGELFSFGAYKAVFIQRLIQRWKFEGDTTAANTLANLLSPEIHEWLHNTPAILIPIPLHERKFRERGFNQTEDLAQALSQALAIPWLPLLQRAVYTRPQKSVEEQDKATNVQDAFVVNTMVASRVNRSSQLVILDDIFTTGSTVNAAASSLRQAGFRSVSTLVIARG